MKKYGILCLVIGVMTYLYGDTYESDYFRIFINNKTQYTALVRFFNEDREQQQYPIKANEHRAVWIKKGVMLRLFFVRVTIANPETGEVLTKDLDFDPNTGINRLKISLKPDLDLRWGYVGDERRDDDNDDY